MRLMMHLLTEALDRINAWLEPYGLEARVSNERLPKRTIGQYEGGSVFEKTILTRIDMEKHRKLCKEENLSLQGQLSMTLYHEVGHALMEQLIDYVDNIPEANKLVDGPFGEKYFDIFFDDCLTEEEVVEEFALRFFYGKESPLSLCFKEMSDYLGTV